MGNILTEIFNASEVMETFNVVFSSQEAANQFQDALKSISSGEMLSPISISGIQSVTPQKKVGEDIYSQPEEGRVTQFFVAPSKEKIVLPVKTEEGIVDKQFLRTIVEDGFIVEYKENNLLDFKLRGRNDGSPPLIQLSVFKEQANSVSEIKGTYEELYDILASLFDVKSEGKEIKLIRQLRDYWRRVLEVEQFTNSNFDPKDNNEVNEFNIDRLHLLFCEQEAVGFRFREFSQHVARSEWEKQKDKFEVGQIILLAWEQQLELLVYGQKLYVSVRRIVPNATIKEIIETTTEDVDLICLPAQGTEIQLIEYLSVEEWKDSRVGEIINRAKPFNQLRIEKFL